MTPFRDALQFFCSKNRPALRLSGTKNLHFADAPFPRFSATALVVKCLEGIWTSKNETASRLRGRIETVLDWATVSKYREGENPARWRGHLDKILPKPSKVQNVEHHAALSYTDIKEFIVKLKNQQGIAARCLEFTILTAARTNESIGATWDEIDVISQTWTIPVERMKAKKPHRVPLPPRAMAIVQEMSLLKTNEFVFPGLKRGLSNMAMLQLLKRMGLPELTVHGFRSSFRDWAAETTHYPNEVVEMALAHTIKNQVDTAFQKDKKSSTLSGYELFTTITFDGITHIKEIKTMGFKMFRLYQQTIKIITES